MRKSVLVTALTLSALAPPLPADAELHALEVTLFMPCTQETAAAAIAALRQVSGVERVQAAAGDLHVRLLEVQPARQP